MSLSANFLTQLENTKFQGNIVLQIDGTYYSQYQPDSGLTIDSDKLGLVDNAKINGVSLDIRRAETPISTVNFSLLDKDGIISSTIGASDSSLQNVEVKFYFGFITGSFDFSDYALLAITRVNKISKLPNKYNFTSKEATDLLQTSLNNTFDLLDGSITNVATTLDLLDASGFPTSGRIKINDEFLQYNGITDNTLENLSRADLASEAADHSDGDQVSLVTEYDDESMNILLDIILNDLGIDASLVDQTSFTDLRDGEFSGEDNFLLYAYDVDNALTWIEERLLASTNTRLFTVNGKITIGLLDQVPVASGQPEITEDHIQADPKWDLTSDKIVNRINARWSWSDGSQKFTKTTVFTDDDSIATYGERRAYELELYGIYTSSIVSNRANRLLERFSTPRASIKVRTHLNRLGINLADGVRLTHRYLPQQGGSLGFSDALEVMSKAVNGLDSRSSITFGLEFTSYSGIRFGLISPSPALNLAINSQKEFTVPDGSCYGVGYRLRLFDNINNVYFPDPVNTIAAINGNVITMTNDFTTTLGSNVSLYFADYDNSSGDQRARYAYTAPDTNIFTIDNSKAYQIIF